MTSIDFYFNAADRLTVACRLAGKAARQKRRVLVYAPQPETARDFDRLLWTWQALSFVPHCHAGDPLAAETSVVIAAGDEPLSLAHGPREVLLNLATECPPFFERHERLLEVIAQDEEARRAGRARYAFYRDRGYQISHHDLGGEQRA